MKHVLIVVFAAVVVAAAMAPAGPAPSSRAAALDSPQTRFIDGPWVQQWKLYPSTTPDSIHFGIERSRENNHWSSSHDVPLSRFRGLTRDDLTRGTTGTFQYIHDAGTLICTGSFANGGGAGTFTFTPNAQYPAELKRLGYEAPNDDELFSMIAMDVSLDFAREMRREFPTATLGDLTKMRIHGVTSKYIQEVHQLGFKDLSVQDFVEMRIHGVSTDLIRDLKAAGFDVNARKVIEMRIHGVSPEYIRALKDAGLNPNGQEIVEMRIHGVSTDFIKDSRAMGYTFTPRELIEMRIHGVNTEYLRKLQNFGMKNLTAAQITKLRIHGVD